MMVSQPGQVPIQPGSAHFKEKDVTKKIYYVYSTMKTDDTEALGW